MKKRILAALAVMFALTVAAQFTAFAYNTPVTDEVGYLTQNEINTLNSYLEQVRNEYNMDVVVYIEQSAGSDNVLLRADDIYDYRGYGVGENRDGIMMYISMYPRKYTFSTCGEGIRVFNDAAIERLTEITGEYLREGDYYNAIVAYAEEAYSMLTAAANGEMYGEGKETADDYAKPLAWGLAVIIPLIVAALTTRARGRGMNTAQYNNSAANYVHGGMNLMTSNDLFLYSSIMRTPRMQNRPNAGGGDMSTTHMSSGGTTHGGGGGGSY